MWTADDEEYCIAASAEDAAKCYEEQIGEPLEGVSDDEPAEWTVCDPAREFTYINGDDTRERKTMAQFVREHGRGYFASTNI
jgi:hypothetical protein